MKRATMVLAVLALVWGGVGQTKASVLTFDDIPGIQVPVPNGYGGLHWNNLSINNGDTFGVGYGAGTVSHPNVIFNGFGNPADVTSATPFTFVGAYLTGAWRDGLSIEVVGSRGGTTLYDQTVVVDAIAPTFFDFNYQDIDSLHFVSSGGTHHDGYDGGDGTQFALDDFTFNATAAVPEPATLTLLGIGLAGMAGYGWRRRKQAVTA